MYIKIKKRKYFKKQCLGGAWPQPALSARHLQKSIIRAPDKYWGACIWSPGERDAEARAPPPRPQVSDSQIHMMVFQRGQ